MDFLLSALQSHPVKNYDTGDHVLSQGENSGHLYFLIDGAVEVVKDEVVVAKVKDRGAIFGDLSALMGVPHTAAARAVSPATFHVVDEPAAFLQQNPAVTLHLCRMLARRLDSMNKYLVDVKQQFSGHDHLGMLDTLMHRQPRERQRPKASTLLDPDVLD
jgi:CRP/FNR family cyclic AMP-dependent transcriptional regulator